MPATDPAGPHRPMAVEAEAFGASRVTSVAVSRIASFAPLPAAPPVPAAEPTRQRTSPRFTVDPAIHGNDDREQAAAAGRGIDRARRPARPIDNDRLPRQDSGHAGLPVAASRPADNVVYLHPDNEPPQDARRTGSALPFAPFIAQLLAQDSDAATTDAAQSPLHLAAADAAYRLVADDPAWVLGPVRPASLIV